MPKRGKKYRDVASLVEPDRYYGPEEAMDLTKQTATAQFDETVELHLRTNADPRHAEQQVRGVAVLPHGLGRVVRVLVFAQGDVALAATQAGAEYVGENDLVERIEGGWVDFDVAIATPEMMGKIGKLGRILGRRGLMPNPRTGTVVQPQDVAHAVEEVKKGRAEFRMDRTAIIHSAIGKVSFDAQKLMENLATVVDAINQQKPSAIKGQFIKSAYLTTTMGPSIPLELASTLALRVD
jgi:large subunit ribosomal protein L1